ncbi:MAG: phosphoribosylamine--glycine ligase [Ignavibacteriales bacterium]|nr:phosphoribosylamine--glycine ligase [Ignavibacteriales bacterium]
MNVMVIGSGGREHALAWKLRQSSSVKRLYCAPGNAGMAAVAQLVPASVGDFKGLRKFALEHGIDLTVVGPEQPLVDGIVDFFSEEGLAVFGPTKSAARLEGSKGFAKEFMTRHQIPTARFRSFAVNQKTDAMAFVDELSLPVVIKADGLAAGKGVIICEKRDHAVNALDLIMTKRAFGSAGERVVIEEFLQGEEASVFAISDGKEFVTLAPAQDHKRILDGDQGKNTGGMGAYAPAPVLTAELQEQVVDLIIRPTLQGMSAEGSPYRGCLYVGLMISSEGPKVLEYNCRFGDPETQVVIPILDGDLAELLLSASKAALKPELAGRHPASAVCVVVASGGYPDAYETGKPIHGLDAVKTDEGEVVFHAGTRKEGDTIVTAGGRVLGVTAIGYDHDLEGTIQSAYRAVHRITFDGAYYRSDIGRKALKEGKAISMKEQIDR